MSLVEDKIGTVDSPEGVDDFFSREDAVAYEGVYELLVCSA